MYEKTDKKEFVRDTRSGGIINRDADALRAYKLKKERSKMVRENDKRISQIEDDIGEIKRILLSMNDSDKS
jgi:hypothetical protein